MNDAPEFPCRGAPDDPAGARLLGLYGQRQPGQWMQRVRVPGGRLSAAQWRVLAEAAERLTPKEPLHLTTRQDVEFHGLSAADVPALQARLAEAGLSTVGACGDTLRNITVCPGAGLCEGSADPFDLAAAIHRALAATEGFFRLPRKFKISFSGCPRACAAPYLNDLGFVARRGAEAARFDVIGAGSMGPAPAAGIPLLEAIPPGQVVACARAAVGLFSEHGDRRNRSRARLRHVRQRLGDKAFRAVFRNRFEAQLRAGGGEAAPPLPPPVQRPWSCAVLTFPDGDVSPQAAVGLADLAEYHNVIVRIGLTHVILAFGRDELSLRSAVERFTALRVAAGAQPVVVACPGSRWCARALVATGPVARAVRTELGGVPDAPTVCISGCPNGCSQHAVARLGLCGRVATVNGQRQEVFDVFSGGGEGRDDRLGQAVARRVPAAHVAAVVGQAVGREPPRGGVSPPGGASSSPGRPSSAAAPVDTGSDTPAAR